RAQRSSLANPEKFWLEASREVTWFTPPQTAGQWDEASQSYQWFPDGVLNMSYNCLDRHVLAGRGDNVAVIYDSPVAGGVINKITYRELLDRVIDFSAVLKHSGVVRGDRVVIYMPMIVETLVGMLACARIGAIHSVVFGGFAAAELAKRIIDCQPRVVLSASCGIEREGRNILYKPLLDEALAISKEAGVVPENNIIFQRPQTLAELNPQQGDVDWVDQVNHVRNLPISAYESSGTPCAPMKSNDPLYILYTSGTTGTPKGVVRDTGGHAAALMWTFQNFFNLGPGDTFFSSSDLGWAVGHSYICYGPLLSGCTTIMYEGKPVGTPDSGAFWRLVDHHNVKAFFTAPTALMIMRREDPHGGGMKRYDLSRLQGMFVAGERCPPEIMGHFRKLLPPAVPIIDHWWQTETGSPITGLALGACPYPDSEPAPTTKLSDPSTWHPELPAIRPGSAGIPVPGYDLKIARVPNEEDEAIPGEQGQVLVKLPLPPGVFTTLWRNHDKYLSSYFERFPGYYDTGDIGLKDNAGYIHIMSRADDIINVAAHRLSTGVFEESMVAHPLVAEACVVPCPHAVKGSLPLGILVLKRLNPDSKSVDPSTHSIDYLRYNNLPPAEIDQLRDDVVRDVRKNVGAFASLYKSHLMIVPRLPKTRSGKVLRKFLRTMVRFAIENKDNGADLASQPCPLPLPATIEDSTVVD
ncbi:hypothetical protein BJ085DRAFT_2893, partial [Dimargaris cristalligena]